MARHLLLPPPPSLPIRLQGRRLASHSLWAASLQQRIMDSSILPRFVDMWQKEVVGGDETGQVRGQAVWGDGCLAC